MKLVIRAAAATAVLFLFASAAVGSPDCDETHLRRSQLAVSEAGFEGSLDHAAIWHVINRRARRAGVSELEMIRRYASPLFAPRSDRQRWVTELHPLGYRPPSFPDELSWDRFSSGWKDVLRDSLSFEAGDLSDPCRGLADHWGGMAIGIDRRRAERAIAEGRWERVDCGPTRNAFFRVVRLRRLPLYERVRVVDPS